MRQLQIHPDDNVVVNVGGEYNGHKTAIRDIKAGENIIKYGYPIGHAICDIKKMSNPRLSWDIPRNSLCF